MDITEGNKLIAEFMGLSKQLHLYESPITGDHIPEDELDYDSSWDWLMPVVKKIIDSTEKFQYDTEEYMKFEEIFDVDYSLSDFMNNRIEGIWNRAVEFIQWYNQQKS